MIESFAKIHEEFARAGVADPLGDTLRLADLICGGVLGGDDPAALLAERGLDAAAIARERAAGRPLEYILGLTLFMGEVLRCAPGALIPREETELLATACLERLAAMASAGRREPVVVEIGTGSGNIAVLLALRHASAVIFSSDISPEALEVARENVSRHRVGERVTLLCGDMFEPLRGRGLEGEVDLVVCNPPYIPSGSIEGLEPQIRDHEPLVALDAGSYGLDIFRRLIGGAPGFLRPGGILAFEIGAGQDRLVARLFEKARDGLYSSLDFVDDGDHIRVACAVRA